MSGIQHTGPIWPYPKSCSVLLPTGRVRRTSYRIRLVYSLPDTSGLQPTRNVRSTAHRICPVYCVPDLTFCPTPLWLGWEPPGKQHVSDLQSFAFIRPSHSYVLPNIEDPFCALSLLALHLTLNLRYPPRRVVPRYHVISQSIPDSH